MKLTKSVLLAGTVLVLLVNTCVVYADAVAEQMQWFKDAKFGMFIHYSAPRSGDLNPSNNP
ncbi:hypothetical protein ACFL6U_02170 [Planctomycetota bacterium]